MSSLKTLIVERILRHGPMTMAEYVDIALYDPTFGYYATRSKRSGREGDFFTSVDVGPLFGELLADQFVEMWRLAPASPFDLVEAGAGTGQLSRDVLDAIARQDSGFYAAIALHLIERSAEARAAHAATLGPHFVRLAGSRVELPESIRGIVFSNELLDAIPAHLVTMTEHGLEEVFVAARDDDLVETTGPVSTPAIEQYLVNVGAQLKPGGRADVNLGAIAWVRDAARRLQQGFLVFVDYGHEAHELYAATHAAGTLRTFAGHQIDSGGGRSPWLTDPGERDLTTHVDLTSIREAAESEGAETLALLDQSYFLLNLGLAERLAEANGEPMENLKRRLAAKTLMMPGGIGSSHKVLILGKNVGHPRLRACSGRQRLT